MSAAAAQSDRKGLLWPALFTLCTAALLVSLGVWQLHRLAWKEGLITQIAARADAAPVPPPPESQWPALQADDYDYRHVKLHGRFDYDKEALVFRPSRPGGWGRAISC